MLYVCDGKHRPHCLHLSADTQLPHVQQLRLTASQFFSRSGTDIGWTDLRALTALERFYRISGVPFRICRAFFDGDLRNAHGSGICFDLGCDLSETNRKLLRRRAIECGLFASVCSEALCPDCVHVCCLRCGDLRLGDSGVFVFSLQRALQRKRCFHGMCSGVFCEQTQRAVIRMQQTLGQPTSGVADLYFQKALCGKSSRTI